MNASGFVEWAWSVPDEQKAALAARITKIRGSQDERFLQEARYTAESVVADDPAFEKLRGSVLASNGPVDFLDEGRDMAAWSRDVGDHLRGAYEDALLGLVAKEALGKYQRQELARPLLNAVPGLPQALGLA